MHNTRRHLHLADITNTRFLLQQQRHQRLLADFAAVVTHLQRAHAGRQLFNARMSQIAQMRHQYVNPQAQRQIQHVFAVLNQDVVISGLAINNGRRRSAGWQRNQPGGRNAVTVGQRRHRKRGQRGGLQRFDAAIQRIFTRHRIFHADGVKTDTIARLHLPHFPQLGFGDRHRADKTAKAGAIAGEDHREVTGEVDGPDGVFAVVHVGRVKPRLAAVGPCPARLRAHQAHAEAVGVVMNLPIAGKKCVNRFLGEKVRRAVRPVEHANPPDLPVAWDQRRRQRPGLANRRRRGAGGELRTRNRQLIGHLQRAPGVSAKLPQREGGAAAEILRHVETVAHRQIASTAGLCAPERQRLPGPDRYRLPQRNGLTIKLRLAVGAGQSNQCIAVEMQYGPLKRKFQPRRRFMVADNAVGQAEGKIVHRA